MVARDAVRPQHVGQLGQSPSTEVIQTRHGQVVVEAGHEGVDALVGQQVLEVAPSRLASVVAVKIVSTEVIECSSKAWRKLLLLLLQVLGLRSGQVCSLARSDGGGSSKHVATSSSTEVGSIGVETLGQAS